MSKDFVDQPMASRLLGCGFTNETLTNLRKSNKCAESVLTTEISGTVLRRSRLVNHFFGGVDYWEFDVDIKHPDHRWYLVGNTLYDIQEADADFYMVVTDADYQDYVSKFRTAPDWCREVIHFSRTPSYDSMPKPPRQDNKSTRVGSGNGYMRDVRFPSLKRGKSTWKRFWKLFPEYEGCKTRAEYYRKQLAKLKEEQQWIQSI